MADSIHGHEVLQFMIDSGVAYTRDSLKREIVARYGEDALFHTCSADALSADQLIDFLNGRGKFLVEEEGFRPDVSQICDG